jgi:hypothetical protein
MEDVEKIARALRELGKIEDEEEAKREEERKHKKEVEGRRNRLRKLYYEQAPPISFHIPPHSSLLNMDDEE